LATSLITICSLFCVSAIHADAYGDALPDHAIARLGTTRLWTSNYAYHLVYSADGRLLTGAGAIDAVRVWDAASGRVVRRFSRLVSTPEQNGIADSVALSSDGRSIALGDSGITFICAVSDGHVLRKLSITDKRGELEAVTPLTFAASDRFLITAVGEDRVRIWDTQAGWSARDLQCKLNSELVSTSATTLATACADGTVRTWELPTGRELHRVAVSNGQPRSVALSRNGRWLAARSTDRAIHVWNTATGSAQWSRRRGDQPGHNHVEFTPDERYLLATTDDALILLDAESGRESRRLRLSPAGFAISPDGKSLALAYDDGVRIVDFASEKDRFAYPRPGVIRALAFAPDGKTLAVAADELHRWDIATRREHHVVSTGQLSVNSLRYSGDGTTLFAISKGEVRAWEPRTGRQVQSFRGGIREATSLAVSPNDQLIAVGGYGGEVALHRTDSGETVRKIGTAAQTFVIEFSPDGKTLATVGGGKLIFLWDIQNGRELRTFCGDEDSRFIAMCVARDNSRIAGLDDRGVIHTWSQHTGRRLVRKESDISRTAFALAETRYSNIAFSPDSKHIAWTTFTMGDVNAVIRVVDATTGVESKRFVGHEDSVDSIAFAPDGKALASGSADGTVLIWDLSAERP
jgi:WD40 repeat protein